MTAEITGVVPGEPRSTVRACAGDRVKLLKSIYDDGADHHPPGWIAQAGDVLIVKKIWEGGLDVAHEGHPGSFSIYPGEYEMHIKG